MLKKGRTSDQTNNKNRPTQQKQPKTTKQNTGNPPKGEAVKHALSEWTRLSVLLLRQVVPLYSQMHCSQRSIFPSSFGSSSFFECVMFFGFLVLFFLLVAAWVSPGRSALQSAEHWCQRRYSQIHLVMMFIIKMKQKRATRGHRSNNSNKTKQRVPNIVTL